MVTINIAIPDSQTANTHNGGDANDAVFGDTDSFASTADTTTAPNFQVIYLDTIATNLDPTEICGTYEVGATATVSVGVCRDTAGNLWLAPEYTVNAETAAYPAQPITSIELGAQNTTPDIGNSLVPSHIQDSWVENSATEAGARDGDDAGATEGTVTFADGATLQFEGIEQVMTDPQNAAPVINPVADQTDDNGNGMNEDARKEIISLFQELATEQAVQSDCLARTELKKHEVRLL